MKIDTKKKSAGILVPVFALRRDNDLGIGDVQAMHDAVDFCSENNIGVLQILPVNETGGDNSPYNAISSVALDPVYMTMTSSAVPGLTDEIVERVETDDVLIGLREGSVSYPRVKKLKVELLQEAFENFEQSAKKYEREFGEFAKFRSDNDHWLRAYTLFRTVMDMQAGSSVWTQWPDQLQSYKSALDFVSSGSEPEAAKRSQRFWAWVQWVAHRQWEGLKAYADSHSVEIMGDLPFGVSRYSADVWAEPHLFLLDWACGAPPERYFQGDKFVRTWGQNWGMPLYDWDAHKKENFAWWRQRISHLTKFFRLIRIDHVLGFFRVYGFPWIPERNHEFVDLTFDEARELTGGELPHFVPRSDEDESHAAMNAEEGKAYLKVLLEASGSSGIVAEDLGMVPDYVRPLIHDLGMAGFAIPIFERVEEDRSFKAKETLHELSLATYGTHDHQPLKEFYDNLVTWWHNEDGHEGWLEVQRLMKFLGKEEGNPPESFTAELHEDLLKALLETPCWLASLMITDLLGTVQRFNEPGMSGDYNWSQRLDRPIKKYAEDKEFGARIRYFKELIKETHRAPLVSVTKR